MNQKIAIVDYDAGNIFSIKCTLEYLGYQTIVSNKKNELEEAKAIILPGVGSFKTAINSLIKQGIAGILEELILNKKKPFLGICLGMQVLFTKSYENNIQKGLNFINGDVILFDKNKILVPHMGWNNVSMKKEGLFRKFNDKYFYFVHSYFTSNEDDFDEYGITNYNNDFISFFRKDNITATQFHPEKSGVDGIELIRIWSEEFVNSSN